MVKPVTKKLRSQDREFFTLVSRAVLTNPFSDERDDLDLKISGLFPGSSSEKRLEKAISEVARRIKILKKNGLANMEFFKGKDRSLMENTFLFHVFHCFMNDFDDFIIKQGKEGDKSLKVPFAPKAIRMMKDFGFSEKDSIRYFGLCFQLRRAFYFIDTSLVGPGPAMKNLRRKLWSNVFTDNMELYNRHLWNRMENFSTLILGETGTGKGTAAAAIGRSGYIPFNPENNRFEESFTSSFVSLNLSQYPENLMESELFGHKKGAFTGAVEDHKGIFDRCSPNGAIFLDEIGEISGKLQVKLLKVIEERTFTPVGSHKTGRFRGRLIAATNRKEDEIRINGILRKDFYYRLCSDIIMVPPLRQRISEDPKELDDLLDFTVTRLLGKPMPGLARMIKGKLLENPGKSYPWPGNVRELEQAVRRILLNGIYTGDLMDDKDDLQAILKTGIDTCSLDAKELLSGYCRLLYNRLGTYEGVSRRTGLDRRTVKKHINAWKH